MLLLPYLLLPTVLSSQCVNINTTSITDILNISYHPNCYAYTHTMDNCCQYFLQNDYCKKTYEDCSNYEDYVLSNLYDQCHSYNTTVIDIPYSDECHNFTLHMEPYCCDNLTHPDCLNYYTQCHTHNHTGNDENCGIPYSLNNKYCRSYTQQIDPVCCDQFDRKCEEIYNWCLDNNPQHVSVIDLFIGPWRGHTVGSSLMIYNNIGSVEDCAQLCLDTNLCRSFDYTFNLNHCHLAYHVLGDIVSGTEVMLVKDPNYHTFYYEKILSMPFDNTHCNVQHPHWIGDGICDKKGGYNTDRCQYDGGDCCSETCGSWYCGIFSYQCLDPAVLYPNSSAPTITPTTGKPTQTPSGSPTQTPSVSPTQTPTNINTLVPTLTPTREPTLTPTEEPTEQPTLQPTSEPNQEPTLTPTKGSNNQPVIMKSESNDNDKYGSQIYGAVVGLIVLVCILFVILGIVLLKNREEQNRSKAMIVRNPTYAGSNTTTRVNVAQNNDSISISDDEIDDNNNDLYDEPVVMEGIDDLYKDEDTYKDEDMYKDEDDEYSNSVYEDDNYLKLEPTRNSTGDLDI